MLHWIGTLTRRSLWIRYGMPAAIAVGAVVLWRSPVPGRVAPPAARGVAAAPQAGPGDDWLSDLRRRVAALVAAQRDTYTQALHSWEALADRLAGERR